MISVGPEVRLYPLQNRWGGWEQRWEVADWYLVEEALWANMKWFQSSFAGLALADVESELHKRFALSNYRTLWELNLNHRDGGWRRVVIGMNCRPFLREWSWADKYLRRPALLVWCFIKNWRAQ